VQDIENIEPVLDIPIYVRWLGEKFLSGQPQKEKFEESWKVVVNEFLELPEFKDHNGYGAQPYQRLRTAFRLSAQLKWAELIRNVAEFLPSSEGYLNHAERLHASHERSSRFIIFGHTHAPGLFPMNVTAGQTAFYVNTGCWRRVVARPSRDQFGPFIPRRLASYFVVDPTNGSNELERYHVYNERHAA